MNFDMLTLCWKKGFKQVDLSEIEQQNKRYCYGRNDVTLPNLSYDIQQVKAKLRNRLNLKNEYLGLSFWALHPEHGPPPYYSSLSPFQERTQRAKQRLDGRVDFIWSLHHNMVNIKFLANRMVYAWYKYQANIDIIHKTFYIYKCTHKTTCSLVIIIKHVQHVKRNQSYPPKVA